MHRPIESKPMIGACRYRLSLLLACALLLALGAGNAWAQGRGAAPAPSPWQGLAQGVTLTSGGETYVVLTQVRAVSASQRGAATAAPQAVLAEHGLPNADVLGTLGTFVLYRSAGGAGAAAPALAAAPNAAPAYPVVYNPRTGQAAVLLDSIIVRLVNAGQAQDVADNHGLTLEATQPRLRAAFYRPGPGQDIAALLVALRADPRVESADPDVLENVATPQ